MAHSGVFWRTGLAAVAAAVLTLAAAPASADGLFQFLFGGFSRPKPPANAQSYADPSPRIGPQRQMESAARPRARADSSAGSVTYCVRTCDGRYFPVQTYANVSAAEACHAFCPASQTRIYSGRGIGRAVAPDGNRYADLDTAFLYRQRLVAGCTCNGRDPFGLAHVDVNTDPTLRPGDVVATTTGLKAFAGMKNKAANFTPVQSDRMLPKRTRSELSQVKIMPPNPGAPKIALVELPAGSHARRGDYRSAQLAR